MENISFFLEKFKSLGLDSVLVKRVFIEQVEKIFKFKLSASDVTIKDDVLYVKAHPALKSELYLKKASLLNSLSKSIGTVKITNFR